MSECYLGTSSLPKLLKLDSNSGLYPTIPANLKVCVCVSRLFLLSHLIIALSLLLPLEFQLWRHAAAKKTNCVALACSYCVILNTSQFIVRCHKHFHCKGSLVYDPDHAHSEQLKGAGTPIFAVLYSF